MRGPRRRTAAQPGMYGGSAGAGGAAAVARGVRRLCRPGRAGDGGSAGPGCAGDGGSASPGCAVALPAGVCGGRWLQWRRGRRQSPAGSGVRGAVAPPAPTPCGGRRPGGVRGAVAGAGDTAGPPPLRRCPPGACPERARPAEPGPLSPRSVAGSRTAPAAAVRGRHGRAAGQCRSQPRLAQSV